MPNVKIVTDSACDLADAETSALDIEVVPLTIRFGAEEFVDRRDLSPKEFWSRVAASPVLPETAAPSPGAFEQAFRQAAAAGAPAVVCITLSSKLSATYASAELAASSVRPDIDARVVDSLSITMGQGSMVRVAAKMAANGACADEIVATVESMIPRTRVYGALDTLDNLKKGGRIGGAKALIGSLLSVKPLLDISTGVVEELGKQRTRSKALAHLTNMVMTAKNEYGSIENLAVMHGDADDADQIVEQLRIAFPGQEIIQGQIGAVIGTHGGPRVVGITFNVPVR
jgi:DegV family protein with EDD domain